MVESMFGVRTPSARALLLSSPNQAHQEELERRFFGSFRLENGTLKLTSAGRLDDLNQMIARHLPHGRPLLAMDVGISSGVTTLEWFQSLRAAGIECRMVAGDLTAHALLWRIGPVSVLTEENGHPLQYEFLKWTLAHAPRRIHKIGLFPLVALSARLMRRLASRRDSGQEQEFAKGVECRRLMLVSPRLLAQPNIEIVDDDVLVPWTRSERFDIVRVANVLNPAYFSEDKLYRALSLLRGRVAPGGLLALCRTQGRGDGDGNHATLMRFDGARLAVVSRLRSGSELEGLAQKA
jgi:hypothetical protein